MFRLSPNSPPEFPPEFPPITTSTYARVEHPDWLGSSRFMSNPHLNTAVGAVAYAPFGESYNKTSAMRLNFTDQFQDSQITDTYDFEVRKLSDIQGRWLSPDPAGLAAVDLTNPQTWNRYAYVANAPLTAIDPLGLVTLPPGEGGGGGGGCFFELPGELCFPGWDPIFPPGPIVPPDDPRGGGGGGGNGAPTPVPGGNPSGIGSGENLGIPSGIPFPEFNILDALGLNPTPGCDFGVCSPVGDPFQSGAEAIGAGACLANPICATIAVTTTVAVIGYYYGPHIIRFAKGGASQNPLPSWVTDRPRPGETAEGFATRVCKAQYPPDGAGCGKGAGSEFNKIKKWAQEWINKHG